MPKRKIFSLKEQSFILDNRLKLPSRELAVALGVSKTIVLRYLKERELSVPPEIIREFRKRHRKTSFTPEEDQMIRNSYLEMPIKRLAKKMGRSATGIMCRIKAMGLEIPKELVDARKKKGRYEKGNVPFNKGKKVRDLVSPEAMERMSTTWFQKGHVPHNTYDKDGTITIRKDSYGRSYHWIRVKMGKWRMLNRYIWEKEYGPIPEGRLIVFKDRNSLNCVLENLECISKSENALRNNTQFHLLDPELKSAIRMKNKLTKTLKNGK